MCSSTYAAPLDSFFFVVFAFVEDAALEAPASPKRSSSSKRPPPPPPLPLEGFGESLAFAFVAFAVDFFVVFFDFDV